MMMLFGEITTKAVVNYEQIARDAVKDVGYDDESKGFDYKTASIIIAIEEQSVDIAQAVHVNKPLEEMGAGDQGIMFGYATDEHESLMPATAHFANQLGHRLTEVRKKGILPWVCPDGKTQVTMEYRTENGRTIPIRVHTIVISTQHTKDVSNEQIHQDLFEHVIKSVIPAQYLDEKTIYHLNPSGRFIIGGPHGDAGLTGRKIIVDSYGGWGAHGGGAFSGKDPSKVDRSAAYAARNIAKSLVHSKLCDRALVQLSYAIGLAEPLSIFIETYGTEKKPISELQEIIKKNYDLRPGAIIKQFSLNSPVFRKTAAYGHFGRNEPTFLWEVPKDLN